MRSRRNRILCCLLLWSFSSLAWGADHIDSAAAVAEPTADITDVFAWMSADASKVNLVMNVNNGATTDTKFSDATQYVFHVNSMPAYGGTATTTNIICTFATDQTISCWAGAEYVTGDASAEAGITSSGGGLKVFAGLRNDPFVFNFDGFVETATTVAGAASGLTLDADGCPALDEATATALVNQLKLDKDSTDTVTDDFATNNVMSIAVQVDKTVVNSGGEILGVWASTNK